MDGYTGLTRNYLLRFIPSLFGWLLEAYIVGCWQNYKNAEKGTCFDADMDFRASLKVRKFSGNLSFIKDTKSLEIYILTTNDEALT